ncbi:prolyl oligopeptidase family serine peptidase [Shewanella surugensis]|uniref:Prolyl oligopeptidase family serine peptidase n=2 Tax=Shewanella surugensis TaxID=212020 RepID=A0ABT0LEE9_9GAMM|nr:prolyl oligopeptidase family serine peptidase [Shewanella surugensis]MCL1126035.1 prolyl oligopeptidase family serine peptidase [Shewanella surugensis]
MHFFVLISLIALPLWGQAAAQRVTPSEIMGFEALDKPVISDDGVILAVEVKPDRGDSHVLVKNINTQQSFTLAGGIKPRISHDGRFVLAEKPPTLWLLETTPKAKKEKLPSGLILLDTVTGQITQFDDVKQAEFNEQGSSFALWFNPKQDKSPAEDKEAHSLSLEVNEFDKGSSLLLLNLMTGQRLTIDHVSAFRFDKQGHTLAVAQNDITHQFHQVGLVDLAALKLQVVKSSSNKQIGHVALSDNGQYFSWTWGEAEVPPFGREYALSIMDRKLKTITLITDANKDHWTLNRYSALQFSTDSQRLFLGRVPQVAPEPMLKSVATQQDLFNIEMLRQQRDLVVWQGDDERIKPHEIKEYDKELTRNYLAVLHLKSHQLVQLSDQKVPDLAQTDLEETPFTASLLAAKRYVLASSDLPYRKMITWAGFYRDFYLVDLNTGHKQRILTQQPSEQVPSLSPKEKWILYYQQGNVFLYDIVKIKRFNLTSQLKVPFADEDHDYPSNAPNYGFGPWLADDSAVLVYDKYDIWQFNSDSHTGLMLTAGEGREQKIQYRLVDVKDETQLPQTLVKDEPILLHGYNEQTKGDGFYVAKVSQKGVKTLMSGDYKLTALAQSKDADRLVYSKQRYDLFPDLYTSNMLSPQINVKQTDFDAQKRRLAWGQAELVHWTNGDGQPLDGVFIKPSHYVEGQSYPVIVYFYRFMSDRLHVFPDMKLNHRPNFAWFADNGYGIFLPDIRFEIGRPGDASVRALTSGVQHLIDMGLAKPDAIGLQGHSWAGYQTAYVITQTPLFKAAVSGAPVSNMTSAYSGIRHGTGLARQFQYETGQSRIGKSLYQAPLDYVENSPVFYADKIQTPLMLMFGDKDEAVPWEQGIEMYLAMRRLGKPVVFLQYKDEPHHLKKYPNKVDYSLRMMAYFDHYLKEKPAPEWIMQGEAYQEYQRD